MLNNLAGLLGTGVAASTTSFESIATVTVGSGGSSSIDFTSIPSTYKHLQIRYIGRFASGATTTSTTANVRFNSDSASNYANHYLRGTGSAADAGAATSQAQNYALITGGSAPANCFVGGIIDILDYANTNKYKTVRSLYGAEDNTNGELQFRSGLWQSTSAISSISIAGANNLAQYSSFALYGVKG